LKLNYDELLSNFAFKFNLRRYTKALLHKFETQTAPVTKQLNKVKNMTPPQYGTLNEWTAARKRAAARAAAGRVWQLLLAKHRMPYKMPYRIPFDARSDGLKCVE